MNPIIFCCDPFDVSRPHSMWEEEVKVASSIGEMYLLDHEATAITMIWNFLTLKRVITVVRLTIKEI